MPVPRISYPSHRVSQLDASILDDELFSLLKQQLSDSFLLISSQPWSYNLHPELWSLILKLVIFKLTTLKTGSSYGFKLQNLKLSQKDSGRVIGNHMRYILLATILGEYIVKKVQSYIFSLEKLSYRPQTLIERVKNALYPYKTNIIKASGDTIQVLELLNFVSFLVFGRYPNLIYRALGITVTPIVADLLKFNGSNVNFEFQNRQLIWNVMTEFLVFILPLLQFRKLMRMLRSFLPKKGNGHRFHGYSESPITTNFTSLPISQCAMCIETTEARGIKAASTVITNPCVTNCNHIFCYICLATRLNAIENGNERAEGCPRCRLRITSFKQYGVELGNVDKSAIMVEYDEAGSEGSEAEEDYQDAVQLNTSADYLDAHTEQSSESEQPFESHSPDYSEHEDLEEEGEYSDDFDSGAKDDWEDGVVM
ncbi:hypothetical protein METBIDRAFT_43498 [Metschnikowia bicuspidata var. bicuspidata NRRL YB-4993]|uniref:RING-type domain-containing protein n=1 Tax=Metschnikowia bicuspidata var. bicuspidata NRRL YB-4993 TaxID=869754 RepID=A0A1A0H911_9ASCO|nr:hypothetical protein METBIDRAFT_43498 [Metschnikowia bicuspidata var. bicuspidata NRRL YB-4993]OBA20490.1 hypothetical protein METBIDRAFT_43498 [Metschnikowia bicuspidata var. bicuspidata NRRL YB-4993]